MKQIPNIFTLLNLLFGSIAIVYASKTEGILQASAVNDFANSRDSAMEFLAAASTCIFIAAVIDFLDGFVARLCNACSELGKHLDSLSDLVSFGVAPAVILYHLLQLAILREQQTTAISLGWLFPAFILSCAAAYRLAKFNIDTTQQYAFKGVPTPAAGLLIASLPLILKYDHGFSTLQQWMLDRWVLYVFIAVLSALMVSNLPLMAMKCKDYTVKNNVRKIIFLTTAVIMVSVFKWLAVPLIFIAYILLSLLPQNKPAV